MFTKSTQKNPAQTKLNHKQNRKKPQNKAKQQEPTKQT